jgi:hypothetical protein
MRPSFLRANLSADRSGGRDGSRKRLDESELAAKRLPTVSPQSVTNAKNA